MSAAQTLDLIELNDRIRRDSAMLSDPFYQKVQQLSAEFLNAVSYVYPEYTHKEAVNLRALGFIRERLSSLQFLFDTAGKQLSLFKGEIQLPLDSRQPVAKMINKHILSEFNKSSDVKFSLQKTAYTKDMSAEGFVQPSQKQRIFDEGRRGFFKISDQLKSKWAHETPQVSLF